MKVELKTLPAVRVAYMRHVGPYGESGITRLWQRFAAWCGEQGLMQPHRTMYGVSHDDPALTPPARCRYDACIEVGDAFSPTDEIGVQTLAGGCYACCEFNGLPNEIHAAWMRLCEWLPDAGWQPADGSPLEVYGADFVVDEKTGAFNCTLCMPARPR